MGVGSSGGGLFGPAKWLRSGTMETMGTVGTGVAASLASPASPMRVSCVVCRVSSVAIDCNRTGGDAWRNSNGRGNVPVA